MSVSSKRGVAGRRLTIGVGLALLMAGAGLCTSSALARSPGHYFLHPYRAIRFQVQGSDGYLIGVAQGSRGHFAVTVRKGPATTVYEHRSSQRRGWSESSLDVRGALSGYGSVAVHFTPRGRPRQLPRYSWCQGPGPTIQPGVVHGEIRFRGERGYTGAAARSATAELETLPGQRCHYGET
ncbi:MAG TPA: hypothetical protein VFU47_09470, partial [Armatimonadota bacterium]|nr:hypothetical protein [Armatimonadota bacterium]